MKEDTQFLLEKAESAIGAAKSLLRDKYRDFAAGHAYYAMFYTAEALLAEKELKLKKNMWVFIVLFQSILSRQTSLNGSIITGWWLLLTAVWLVIMLFEPNLKMMKFKNGSIRQGSFWIKYKLI